MYSPTLIIGAGGTGKWVLTYVKRDLIDYRNRELLRQYGEAARQKPDFDTLPPEIRLLSVDVSAAETVPVSLDDAFRSHFSLEYPREGGAEFCFIGAHVRGVIEAIAGGRTEDYPWVARWLNRQDARQYKLAQLEKSTEGGAGQLRQLGRLSLFSQIQLDQRLPGQIAEAVRQISTANAAGQKLTVAVVGSLAGGTGSGTLYDLAVLVHKYAGQIVGGNFEMIGYVVLPTAFSRHAGPASVESVRMEANGFAGMRELTRLVTAPDSYEFSYGENLELRLADPLFGVTYLVEGSRHGAYDLAGVAPQNGIYPLVAGDLLLHATSRVDYTNLRATIAQKPRGAFSTVGSTLWIFPAEEMIWEHGHVLARLALESLQYGRQLDPDADQRAAAQAAGGSTSADRDAFYESASSASSALVRFVRSFILEGRKRPLRTTAMMQALRFSDKEIDRDIPLVSLTDDVPIASWGSKGDPVAVRDEADRIVRKALGSREDKAAKGQWSMHATLNHYRTIHDEHFERYLRNTLLAALNDDIGGTPRVASAGPAYAMALLAALVEYLNDFQRLFVEIYAEQQASVNGTRLDEATQKLHAAEEQMLHDDGMRERLTAHGKQQEYLHCRQQHHDLVVQDEVHSAVVDIVDAWIRRIGQVGKQVDGWASMLQDNIEALRTRIGDIQRRRLTADSVSTHWYLTKPNDRIETEFLSEALGARAGDDLTKAPTVQDILKPMSWKWDETGRRLLLLTPSPAGAEPTRSVRDWQAYLPEFVTCCFPPLAGIRSMTIWQVLHRLGETAESCAQKLVSQLAPVTALNETEQQRTPAIALDEKSFALARWENPQSGDGTDSPRRLSAELRSRLPFATDWDDPHRLLAVGHTHLVKASAVACMPRMRESYERLLTGKESLDGVADRVPLHLFPGESLAAELELSSVDLLNERVELPPSLVALLEHEQDLFELAVAIAYQQVCGGIDKLDGTFRWLAVGADLEDGEVRDVNLGGSIEEAARRFLTPDTRVLRQARASVHEAIERKVLEGLATDDFTRELRSMARTPLIPDTDPTDPPDVRRGYDRCLRMLLRRHADRLGIAPVRHV